MSKLVFREELISPSYQSEHSISYTDSPTESKILDWCQVFYLTNSILICKVYSSTLYLTQFLISAPTSEIQIMKSCEYPLKIKFSFPGAILPNICCKPGINDYILFVLTSQSKLFKLTFPQNSAITTEKQLISMQGYNIGKDNPACINIVEFFDNEFEVCVGMKNGSLTLATFPEVRVNEFLEPLRTKVIEVPVNFVNKVKSIFFRSSVAEEALRTVMIGKDFVLALNNWGTLRVYDLGQSKFVSELRLETGIIVEYKFACFGTIQGYFLAFGHCKRDKWGVSLIKIVNENIEVISQFTESGILFDLAIDQTGLWMAWGNFRSSRVILKPFSQSDQIVFSCYDEILTQTLADDKVLSANSPAKAIIDRIFHPGRFSKSFISQSVKKYLDIDWQGDEIPANKEQAENILNNLKILDSQTKEIWCLGTSDLPGDYPVVIIRGNEKIGFIKRVENLIENSEIIIKKLANDWNFLGDKNEFKEFSRFRVAAGVKGLDLCLTIIRIWRQKNQVSNVLNLKKQLKQLLACHISDNFLQILKRLVPTDLNEKVIEQLAYFSQFFSDYVEKDVKIVNEYWPKNLLALFGNSLISAVRSQFEYFFDVTLLLFFTSHSFFIRPNVIIEQSTISDCTSVTLYLFALLQTLTSPWQIPLKHPNEDIKKIQSWKTAQEQFIQYTFPLSISTLYIYSRSEFLLGDKYTFEIWNSSTWFNNSINLCLKDLMNIIYEGPASRSPGQKLEIFLEDHKMSSSNLLNILSAFGQVDAIKIFFSCLECFDSFENLFVGKGLLSKGNSLAGQQALIKSVAGFLSGSLDSNEKKLQACPLNIEAKYEVSNIFSIYNEALTKDLPDWQVNKIILSEFINSSLYATFDSLKIGKIISQLIQISRYSEALTLTESLSNTDKKKFYIQSVIEDCLEKDLFSVFLNSPSVHRFKEFIMKFLIEKSWNEKFDVHRTIMREKYREQASSLFLEEYKIEDRDYSLGKGVTWTEALYCFCSRYSYFNTAASAGYQSYSRVKKVYKKMNKRKTAELKFIKEIMVEYLLLTLLATRNISEDNAKCWFLTPTIEPSNNKEPDTKIRKAIELRNLEQQLKIFLN